MSTQTMVHAGEKAHPQSREYVILAIILGVVTGLEVAAWYWDAIRSVMIGSTAIDLLPPILIVMSAFKFALVIMFYMHLKADSRFFTFLFGAPLLLATGVLVALLLLFFGALTLRGAAGGG